MVEKQTRIKVNKGVESKTRILNLTMTYLGVFAVFVLFGVVLIMANFTFSLLVIVGIFLTVIYMILQYLDRINYFENFKKSSIPDEFFNDLF
jgi:hypothetical protein